MTSADKQHNDTQSRDFRVEIETLTLGPFQTNTYLAYEPESKKGVVIDPGFEGPRILAAIEKSGVAVEKILLTHGHVDHVSALGPLVKAVGDVDIAVHEADASQLSSVPAMARMFGLQADRPPEPTVLLHDGDTLEVGGLDFKTLHTPGHTPGGVCFLLANQKVLFCGDTLFYRGIGRTDLPGGSFGDLSRSIRTKIYALDGTIRAFPGHGPPTVIRDEMFSNPFVTL